MPSPDDYAPVAAPSEEPAQKAEGGETAGTVATAETAGTAGTVEPTEGVEAVETSSAWSPSKENVVWNWMVIEDRIVEMTE